MAKKANGFIILVLFLSSLFFWPTLMDKYLVSRFLLQTFILLAGGYFFYSHFKKQRSGRLNLVDIAFLIYYLVHLISIFWAHDFGEAVFTTQKILIGFVIYYFTRLLLARKSVDILSTLAYSSLALTVVLLLYVPAEIVIIASEEGLSNEALYNVSGAMGNKSLLAEFLLLLIPLNIIGIIRTPKQSLFSLVLICQLILILILQVRSSYLVLFICSVVYSVWGLYISQRFRKIFVSRVLPAGALVLAGIFSMVRFGGLFPDLANRLNIATWSRSDTVIERLFIWEKTISLISENWLFGLGSGNWKIFFPSNSIKGVWRFEALDTFATRVHNDYLEIFAETGILGILSFLAIFGLTFFAGIRKLRIIKSPDKEMLFIALLGLLGFAIISFVDFPKERLEHQALFAILLALCVNWSKEYLTVGSPGIPGKWYPVFFGLLMILLTSNIISGVLRFKGEVHVRKAITAKIGQNWPVLIEESKKSMSRLYTIDPTTVPIPWYEGIGHFHLNDIPKAHAAFQLAYHLNPYNYHVLNNLGTTLARQENFDEAIPLFEEALRINPSFNDCKFNIAYAAYQVKDYEKALYWASRTKESDKKKIFMDTIMEAFEKQ